uniref:Uncharacterized protein n=1 Tax=Rhizophora mucronata TaxID=61149 RepID=A0A2P2QIV2_RHIMU
MYKITSTLISKKSNK